MRETFTTAGYYRVDLNDKVSVLAMNTIYFDSLRNEDKDVTTGKGQK